MGFEKELERVISRRRLLAGLGLTVGSVAIAKLALLQTKASELARQADQAEGVTGFGSGPGDADSFAPLVSGSRGDIIRRNANAWERLGIGASGTYLRSDGSDPAWRNITTGDLPDAYVQKSPTSTQTVDPGTNDIIPVRIIGDPTSSGTPILELGDVATQGWRFYRVEPANLQGPGIRGFISGAGVLAMLTIDQSGTVYDFLTWDGNLTELNMGGGGGNAQPSAINLAPPLRVVAFHSGYAGGSGAQVGLTTSATGTASTLVRGDHRHAFSGRFGIGPGYIRDASLGGATPAKFTRLISVNAWTLRRLSVFALTAPVGGTDTYGVVNAAGTLQGTAVSLAAGVNEAASALQVTNLTGGTVYYFAVTARAPTSALDVTLVPEYTMNV